MSRFGEGKDEAIKLQGMGTFELVQERMMVKEKGEEGL